MNMLMLYLLIIWEVEGVPQHPFNMYNINSHPDGYCLLTYAFTYVQNPVYKRVHQTTSYCLRISEEDNFTVEFNFKNTDDLNFTFVELKEQNITSQMLLSWSATIDLAEQYEIFLHGDLNTSFNETVLFHNCTSPWFGPLCRFTFDYDIDISFEDIVDITFKSKHPRMTDTEVTCYKHLHCETILSCLDWREICDRKSDCLDSSDERDCWQLEVNGCNENEFRCRNGLCIPIEFFHDVQMLPDCLDRTDELSNNYPFRSCFENPHFQCEEHTCGPNIFEFPCGDGQCSDGIDPCNNGRSHLLPSILCAYAVVCYWKDIEYYDNDWCEMFCLEKSDCVVEYCAEFYDFRNIRVLLGHVRLIYLNNELNFDTYTLPDYVCYNEKLCVDFLPATEHFNNWTCRRIHELGFERISSDHPIEIQIMHIKNYFRACLVVINETFYCNYSTMYQCQNSSKCISKQRLLDNIQDCPYNDDETYNQSCSLSDIHQRFKCSVDGIKKCFTSLFRSDEINNCEYSEDSNFEAQLWIREHIVFNLICDGKTDLLPVLINEQNETDETNCEHWACNNTYSRCDRFWLCKDGADEVDCELSVCPTFHHECVFLNDTSKVSCLPIAQAGNDFDDCLGGTDERKKYLIVTYDWATESEMYGFHCWNDTKSVFRKDLCNKNTDCRFNDDELFCKRFASKSREFCDKDRGFLTGVEKFLCQATGFLARPLVYYFKLTNILMYPLQLTMSNTSFVPSIEKEVDSIDENGTEAEDMISEGTWWCNRGIPIRRRLDGNTSKLYCLCPPSYYGNRCQYQNQRVSLTLQIQVSSDWRKVFTFIITLIDDEKNIESHDYVEYLPVRDCIAKYNIYLLYATRPKDLSKQYSVQIDAFNQLTMSYRASWIFPLRFSFLPVHRLPVLLKVPLLNMEPIDQCWPSCVHGQCFPYVNNLNSTFCRCQPGWSGAQCNIKYICDCALGSICISDSICLCPRDRFGPRCHLFQFPCRFVSCLNGGQCVSTDPRYTSVHSKRSTCICPEGYTGDRCELQKKETQIDISFHEKLPIPSSLLIHLIDIGILDKPNSTSVMKKIAFDQYSITFYVSVWFHIAFAQMFNHYYLVILQEERITFAHISTQVLPSHRCQSIDELFDQTFAKQHLLKRIKYYHLPCQQQSELVCFYDEVHFCLCTLSRTVNCFEFNHNMTYDCGGYNYCEHGGHCFEENYECPTSFCVCNQCYFGSRCQFSTKESILSLDTILGYHIRSGNEIRQQPTIVKVGIALTMIIFFFGFINISLSLITFREQETRNVGCGLYLFASSIISLNIVIVSTVKFWLLLASQIGSINNRLFLQIQCVSIDFLLRSLLSMSDWFSACVAIERAVNISQGIGFTKSKSKQIARWIILIVIVSTGCTHIYDPLYRRLIDDEDEQRTWCITQYPSSVQIFNRLLNIFHFFLPFSINCISAVVVIIIAARTRSNSQKKKPFKEHLREQLQHHKHLLISPSILVVLALPRLIISFLSGCMKSARDSWLYLIGYFISFVPSMMTFVVFVLPSEMYRKEFNKSMKRLWQR